MTYAFAKDSRACAVCHSWAGARELSADMTLACVPRYSAEGECRTAVSQDYGRVTKSYHTCDCWSPMPLLRAHGARHARTPGPAAAMEGLLAATPADKRPAAPQAKPPQAGIPVPVAGGVGDQAVGKGPTPAPQTLAAPAPQPSAVVVSHPPVASAPRPPVASAPRPPVASAPRPPVASAPAPEACASTPLELDRVPPMAGVLLSYWRRVKGDRAAPGATELDTAHLRDSLARLCLFERAADGGDFVYRACGRAVRRRLDARPAGLRLADCHDEGSAARLAADLRACLDAVRPMAALVRGDPLLPGQKYVELLLPLAGADGRPAMVLAWRNVPGG